MLEIITVTKDDHEGLKRTLLSVATLRKANLINQLIVDGSSEKIAALNKDLASSLGVKYFYQHPSGISSAFNFGLDKASSEWVWYLNGGDEFNTDIDPDIIINLLKNSMADMLIFEIMIDNKITTRPPLYALWPPFSVWIPHPGTIVKRKIMVKNHGFDTQYKVAMDADLFFRLLAAGAIADLISIPISRFSTDGISGDIQRRSRDGKNLMIRYSGLMLRLWFKSLLNTVLTFLNYWRGSRKKSAK